jgi:hypothetical protein
MKVSSWFAGSVCALVMGAATLGAQQKSPIGKGGWIVGGSAGLSHTNNDGGPGTTNLALAPFGLYFFAPRLALGGTVSLAYASTSVANADSHDSFVGIEPTIRYFFGDPAGKLFPYLNASIGPSWESFHIDNGNNNDQTVHGLDVTGSAGLMQMLSTHVGLTGELFYSHQHRSTDFGTSSSTNNRSSYGLRFGFSAFVF